MTKIRTVLFASATFAALAFTTSAANAFFCRSGESQQVVLRFPMSLNGMQYLGDRLDVKSEGCVPGSKTEFTIDGMPGIFTSKQDALDFVKAVIAMQNAGTKF